MPWNEVLGKALHKGIDIIGNDMKDNTLTFGATTAFGIGAGARGANMAARAGFTMLERKVASKTLVGGAVGGLGAATGHVSGISSTPLGKLVKVANKVTQLEKKFDETRLGKAIDNEIAYGQNLAHRGINKAFGT